jgi:hypothetical protein
VHRHMQRMTHNTQYPIGLMTNSQRAMHSDRPMSPATGHRPSCRCVTAIGTTLRRLPPRRRIPAFACCDAHLAVQAAACRSHMPTDPGPVNPPGLPPPRSPGGCDRVPHPPTLAAAPISGPLGRCHSKPRRQTYMLWGLRSWQRLCSRRTFASK